MCIERSALTYYMNTNVAFEVRSTSAFSGTCFIPSFITFLPINHECHSSVDPSLPVTSVPIEAEAASTAAALLSSSNVSRILS
jgi:hypothetical protein